jgi:hypothetical protein
MSLAIISYRFSRYSRAAPSSLRGAPWQLRSPERLAGAAGGLIGSILAKRLGDHHAHYLQEQLDRGRLLLWVRTWDPEHENRAVEILSKCSARDVHVHALPATA